MLVPGIACLLNHVEHQRQWLQPRVLKAIDRWETHGVLKAMQEAIRGVLDDAGDAPLDAGKYLRNQAGKSVRKRLAKLLDESAACRPGTMRAASCHAHFRQAAALHAGACQARLCRRFDRNRRFDRSIDAVKKVQTLLGDIHDCDVWVDSFSELAQNAAGEIKFHFGNPQRFERLRPGLDYLRQERKDHRRQAFASLVGFGRNSKIEEFGIGWRAAWNGAAPRRKRRRNPTIPARRKSCRKPRPIPGGRLESRL